MSQPIVVIDPGHGGNEVNGGSSPQGVRGPGGTLEKDVTLALARRLATHLGGVAQTVLTREGDTNPSLAHRSRSAAEHAADVFLSLHANAGLASARGTEVYVHDETGPHSRALAGSLSRALSEHGLPQRGLWRAPMAVLRPSAIGPRAAACLVEIDYLSSPEAEHRLGNPREIDAIAHQLSRGVRSYLQQQNARRSNEGRVEPYAVRYGDGFDDADQLTMSMRDERAADVTRVSTIADARALVTAYSRRGWISAWPNLDAQVVADQIDARCLDSRRLQQGNLNLCGPAAFLNIWAARDPVGYVSYALGLLESGVGVIGDHEIRAASALIDIPYPRFGRSGTISTPAADFLCMAPLRNSANALLPYDPSSGLEGAEGMTRPGELADWLRWTGTFSTVRDEGNWTRSAGIDHALELMPGSGSDVAMLVNVNALAQARSVETMSGSATTNPVSPDRSFILGMFPNHFVVLLSELIPDRSDDTVSLSAWTWAGSYVFSGIPVRTFSRNYYGAVKAFVRR